MPIDSLKARMFRIKQANSLDLSTALTTSPRRFSQFFMKFRGPQAHPNRPHKNDGLPHLWAPVML